MEFSLNKGFEKGTVVEHKSMANMLVDMQASAEDCKAEHTFLAGPSEQGGIIGVMAEGIPASNSSYCCCSYGDVLPKAKDCGWQS